MKSISASLATLSNLVTTDTSVEFSLKGAESVSVQVVSDVNTPSAETFAAADVDVTENTATITAHGLLTGLKGQLTTDDTLPDGLSLLTDYFIIVVDADTVKFATSLANALAGTPVDILDQGVGTHTFTPTALAGGAAKLQKSNDKVNWHDEGSATNITADGSVFLEKDRPTSEWGRLHLTLTAGSLSAAAHVLVKG